MSHHETARIAAVELGECLSRPEPITEADLGRATRWALVLLNAISHLELVTPGDREGTLEVTTLRGQWRPILSLGEPRRH